MSNIPASFFPSPFSNGLCHLTQFGLISASGSDATKFLHGQLTNDIQSLPENRSCLAGYCSTKGRLLASLLAWKSPNSEEDSLFLEVSAQLQESLQKRLQIYVMRSKVKLGNVTDSHAILGILGEPIAQSLTEWFPMLPTSPYEVVHSDASSLIRLTDAEKIARYQWIMNKPLFEQIWPVLNKKIPVLPSQVWALSDIHAGIPHISLATQEKFVPQMVNYDLIGGVHFKKGCYPGQEIVARTHYLGKQKRRMALAQIDNATVESGAEVFASTDPGQPCGMIVNAEPNGSGGNDCLIEIKTACLSGAIVQLNTGEVCRWLPMPYSLPTDSEG